MEKTNKAEVLDRFLEEAISLAREDSPRGFAAFYALITNKKFPPYAWAWTEKMYDARERGKALVVEAFRGSSKTTTFAVVFVAHRIGLEPASTNLILQVKDTSAKKRAASVGHIIDKNPWWKQVFPNVIPDKDRGWAQSGYWVRDTEISDDEWSISAPGPDPTLMGSGMDAEDSLGMHPSGVLILDDIHSEKNTRSDREFSQVMDRLTGTIFPTLDPGAFNILIGTPWREDDAIAYAKDNKLRFEVIRQPLFEKDEWEEFNEIVDIHEPTEEQLSDPNLPQSAWPERYTPEEVLKRYHDQKRGGAIKFAQMYLLDLEQAKGKTLKRDWLHYMDGWEEQWPVYMGVDYATADADLRVGQERDYFAVAICRQMPSGRIIVTDGIRSHLSQGQAEQKLKQLALVYPKLKAIGIETDGKGEEFYNLMVRHSDLPLFPVGTKNKSKPYRIEKVMAPSFEFAQVWLADQETPFLKAFKDEWLSWPDGRHDDTLDSVFYALVAAGKFLEEVTASPVRSRQGAWYGERVKTPNPFGSLGRKYA